MAAKPKYSMKKAASVPKAGTKSGSAMTKMPPAMAKKAGKRHS